MRSLRIAAPTLASLVGAACIAACDQAYIGEPPSTARVTVTPSTATLRVGDSVLVQAVALDHRDRPIEAQRNRPLWSSSDALTVRLVPVASPSSGVAAAWAHAVRAGAVALRAERRGRGDSVGVTVR